MFERVWWAAVLGAGLVAGLVGCELPTTAETVGWRVELGRPAVVRTATLVHEQAGPELVTPMGGPAGFSWEGRAAGRGDQQAGADICGAVNMTPNERLLLGELRACQWRLNEIDRQRSAPMPRACPP